MNLSLKGKNALVCGSTQGIGKAAAMELALMGANVILVARNETSLQDAIECLDSSQGQQHDYFMADFTEPATLQEALKVFLSNNRDINILVNNTGGPSAGPAHTAGIDAFRAAFEMHLICNQILVQSVMEGMIKSGYGRIINVISTSVKQPLENLGVSNAIRGAVASWAKTLANELGKFGITVNNVLPGATNTIRLQSIIQNKSNKTGQSITEVTHEMQAEIPASRFAEPEEIAAAIAFLASPAAAYINGINLPVDGGRTKSL
jgi:3-oxoacyl-[acyl-carrier protein] reductase